MQTKPFTVSSLLCPVGGKERRELQLTRARELVHSPSPSQEGVAVPLAPGGSDVPTEGVQLVIP